MYQSIKSSVSINGQTSSFFPCENGVRQGENLSPVLFSIFLNDLESHLTFTGSSGIVFQCNFNATVWLKILVLLYADDTIIVADSPKDMQNSLNSLSQYCEQCELKVNHSKTKIIVFGARNVQNYKFTYNENEIDISSTYKYLGLTFSSNGSFLNARKMLAEQARKAMHSVLTKSQNLELPIDLQLKLFDDTVAPYLALCLGNLGLRGP